jgi:hypothetical protein
VEAREVGGIDVIATLFLGLEDQLDFLGAVCHDTSQSTAVA